LTTYVDISEEIRNLESHGLKVIATVGNTKQVVGYDTNDSWVYLLTKLEQISVDSTRSQHA
jgi:hypothetical protein